MPEYKWRICATGWINQCKFQQVMQVEYVVSQMAEGKMPPAPVAASDNHHLCAQCNGQERDRHKRQKSVPPQVQGAKVKVIKFRSSWTSISESWSRRKQQHVTTTTTTTGTTDQTGPAQHYAAINVACVRAHIFFASLAHCTQVVVVTGCNLPLVEVFIQPLAKYSICISSDITNWNLHCFFPATTGADTSLALELLQQTQLKLARTSELLRLCMHINAPLLRLDWQYQTIATINNIAEQQIERNNRGDKTMITINTGGKPTNDQNSI